MKVLYIAARWDPEDHNQASGTDYEICQAFKRGGAEVEVVGPFHYDFSGFERILMGIHSRVFDTKLFKYPFMYFFKSAYHVNQAINNIEHDLVVSMYSAPIVLAKLKKPLLYFCDSTVLWIKKNWRNHANFTYFTMMFWESLVIKKSSHVITFSESNAKVLHDKYHVPEDQLNVFAIPASLPYQLLPVSINKDKSLSPVKLLLVGKHYVRKGVDIAIEVVRGLNQLGVNAQLRIVGMDGDDSENIKFMGYYNKTNQSELKAYMANYEWSNFLLHPARFEAAGIVPSEAAAFGVPTVTNNAGGLATTVQDGVSGVVLPKASPADMYVSKITEFVRDPASYRKLVKTTKDRYQRELHWHVLGKMIFSIANKMIEG
jgi:glycosyltransferase involved in cell wall biosynthesis